MTYKGGMIRPGAILVVEEPSDETMYRELFARGRVCFGSHCAMRHGKLLKKEDCGAGENHIWDYEYDPDGRLVAAWRGEIRRGADGLMPELIRINGGPALEYWWKRHIHLVKCVDHMAGLTYRFEYREGYFAPVFGTGIVPWASQTAAVAAL